MNEVINIGIIGDFDPDARSHQATNTAILHAAQYLGTKTNVTWLPTPSFLKEKSKNTIKSFDTIWVAPKSPYKSMEGAIEGIRLARELDRPLIGT